VSVATLSNTEVQVQRPTESVDAWGGKTRSAWTTQQTLRMRVQPLGGDEIRLHGREEMRVTHKVYVTGKPDITDRDRLKPTGSVGGTDKWDSARSLYVRAVRNIDLVNSFLTIECEEREDVGG
jgi:head-tail adaptor